ncbi:MAG: hypothetical protein ACYDCQ_09885 [Dehalococcoidia bacterium]
MRHVLLVSTVVLLWAAAAGMVLFAVDATPARWAAPVGFAVVAASVAAAWAGTASLLRRVRLTLPFRPE